MSSANIKTKNKSMILNVEIDNISMNELLAQLEKGVLVTPNVDQMVKMQSDREYYEIVKDFDVYERFEKPLVDAGWQVIVFIPSEEEDSDRITCGNSLIAKGNRL